MSATEHWLRGPVDGIDPLLQPAAHALLQSLDDVQGAVDGLLPEELALRPGGCASLAFHLRHLAGSTDRLFTYARGESLRPEQREALRAESQADPMATAPALVEMVRHAYMAALEQLRSTPASALLDKREVGREGLPSNVLGLLFHAAEHAQRHTGQVIATAKVVRGLRLGSAEARHAD